MAAQSSSLTGSLEGIATAKPPLGTQTTARMPESKSPIKAEAPAKTQTHNSPVQETPTNRSTDGRQGREPLKVSMVEMPDEDDDTSF